MYSSCHIHLLDSSAMPLKHTYHIQQLLSSNKHPASVQAGSSIAAKSTQSAPTELSGPHQHWSYRQGPRTVVPIKLFFLYPLCATHKIDIMWKICLRQDCIVIFSAVLPLNLKQMSNERKSLVSLIGTWWFPEPMSTLRAAHSRLLGGPLPRG